MSLPTCTAAAADGVCCHGELNGRRAESFQCLSTPTATAFTQVQRFVNV